MLFRSLIPGRTIAPGSARCHLVWIGPAPRSWAVVHIRTWAGPPVSGRGGSSGGRGRRFRNQCLKSLARSVLSPHSIFVFLLAILSTKQGIAVDCSVWRRLAGGSPRGGIVGGVVHGTGVAGQGQRVVPVCAILGAIWLFTSCSVQFLQRFEICS